MKKDLLMKPLDFTSSFLSCEKDLETILTKLFLTSQPYSDELKKLLIVNMPDCLDNKNSIIYNNAIKGMTLSKLKEKGYIRWEPNIKLPEHEEVKNYLQFSFDTFLPNYSNPQFRDCDVFIDVICHSDCWTLDSFQSRPIKICGYIDAILNNTKLSGIGTFQFGGCKKIIFNEVFSGYTLYFKAIHGTDDKIPSRHGWAEKTEEGWHEAEGCPNEIGT